MANLPLATQGQGRQGSTAPLDVTTLRSRATLCALYFGFTITGLACVLPGVLLPTLLQAWGWNDRQGGRLFLLIAGGSALGPLLVDRMPPRSLASGFLVTATAAAAWCLDSRFTQFSGMLWGVGLGMSMTGISLLSQELDAHEGGALLRLNFLWAVGAFACPLFVRPLLHRNAYNEVLWAAAVLLLCGFVSTLLVVPWSQLRSGTAEGRSATAAWRLSYWQTRGLPYGLLTATALATGVEASIGGWLATYAQRSTHMRGSAIAAPGCLWAGLLFSRGLGWIFPRWMERQKLIRALLAIVMLGAAGMVLPINPTSLLASSFALGFGLGPLYPALLARVLAVRHSSMVFFAAGVASSVMPWATGVLSSETGLLRVGLAIPLLGTFAMALGGWQPAHRRESGQGTGRAEV